MKDEEHDDLWELLGRAKEPVPSAFFSRNVLRSIRNQAQEKAMWWRPLGALWRPLTGLAVVLALGGICSWQVFDHRQQQQQISELAQQVATSPDYTVITHLDELLAYEENSVWLDKTTF